MGRFGSSEGLLKRAERAISALVHPAGDGDSRGTRRVCCVGHRGAPRDRPENTIDSFTRAIELGADGIEADVCLTRDEQAIVWHDADPDGLLGIGRQVGTEGYPWVPDVPPPGSDWRKAVRDLTLAEVHRHYGYRKRGQPLAGLVHEERRPELPLVELEELFDWAAATKPLRRLYLDVKLVEVDVPRVPALFRCLQSWCRGPAVSGGPELRLLCPIREVHEAIQKELEQIDCPPSVRAVADFELPGVLREARELGLRDVSLGCDERTWGDLLRELDQVLAARDGGEIDSVIVWTIDTPERLRELVDRRVDGILTDDLPALRQLVSS